MAGRKARPIQINNLQRLVSNSGDPAHSDADFLVEFASGVQPGLNAIFGAKADLEALLGRCVDLVESGAVRNPYVLANINRHHEIIFSDKY